MNILHENLFQTILDKIANFIDGVDENTPSKEEQKSYFQQLKDIYSQEPDSFFGAVTGMAKVGKKVALDSASKLKKMGKDFLQLTGNDDNALEFNRRGGVGAISVTANIAPKLCSKFQKLSIENEEKSLTEAKTIDKILQPVHHSMFVESTPSPVKYAAKLLNLCEDDVRLPLVKVTNNTKEIIKKALKSANLI